MHDKTVMNARRIGARLWSRKYLLLLARAKKLTLLTFITKIFIIHSDRKLKA